MSDGITRPDLRADLPADVTEEAPAAPDVWVVGMGADGWEGLTEPARDAFRKAEVIMGGPRQLGLLPALDAERALWPSPMMPGLSTLFEAHRGRRIAVAASGDPMFYGVGTTLVRLLGADRVRVVPHASSLSLACARLGWPVEDTEVVSAVGRAGAVWTTL